MLGPASITLVFVFGTALPLCKWANDIKSTKQLTESINGRQLDLFNTKHRINPNNASLKAGERHCEIEIVTMEMKVRLISTLIIPYPAIVRCTPCH